ncbi:MAG: hypothetical protein GF330_02110 [Candidatus Eisenbacteria bacterium]|nr:hypothetical protein [Candidatus Eisenbacteria bacterium]
MQIDRLLGVARGTPLGWLPRGLLLTCWLAWGLGTAGAEPCTDPDDPCAEVLLDAFEPYLFFEDLGPGGFRLEFPTDFVGADDDTVENNFEQLVGGPAYGVYRHALRLETLDAPCWLLQYHYYFPANWRPDVWAADGYTHEHDWEWVYVWAGWSEPLQRYIGYAATLSKHDRDNREALSRLHTYLFPLIVWDPDASLDWVADVRRLTCWTDDNEALLTRAGVIVSARGNELRPVAGDRGDLIEAGRPAWHCAVPGAWELGTSESDCQRTTDRENCFGDPRVCALPFICSGSAECDDCGADRYVPWARDGLWDASSVTPNVRFPEALCTIVDPEPVAAEPLDLQWGEGCCQISWSWSDAQLPAMAELLVVSDDRAWRCEIGCLQLPERSGALQLRILDPANPAAPGCPERERRCPCFAPPCFWSPRREGGWLEIWLTDARGDARRVARSRRPLPSVGCEVPVRLELSAQPHPVRERVCCSFRLPQAAPVELELIDATGRCVVRRALGRLGGGRHCCWWDLGGSEAPQARTGVFWIRLRAGRQVAQTRVACVR